MLLTADESSYSGEMFVREVEFRLTNQRISDPGERKFDHGAPHPVGKCVLGTSIAVQFLQWLQPGTKNVVLELNQAASPVAAGILALDIALKFGV